MVGFSKGTLHLTVEKHVIEFGTTVFFGTVGKQFEMDGVYGKSFGAIQIQHYHNYTASGRI